MSYTTKLLEALKEQLKASDYKKVEPLVLDFARERALQYEEELKNSDPNTIPFGKYNGQAVQDIFKIDPLYVKWMTTSDMMKKHPRLHATCLNLVYAE
jgi:uncharacterized protein (DUF3820 family)